MRNLQKASIVVIACLFALLVCGQLWAQKPTQTITGTVKRAEMRQGKVVAVYIEDSVNGEFLVARGTTIGKKLTKQVGAKITATGYVRKPQRDPEFDKVIDILNYEVVEPPGKKE